MARPALLRALACGIATLATGCAASSPAPRAPIDLARADLVDLTHPFDERTLYWPTETEGFVRRAVHDGPTERGYYYRAGSFCAPEHGGTHLDAPSHFAEGGAAVEAIPLARLVAPAYVIDARPQVAADRDYRLTREDVERFEARHGRIADGAIVIMHTGWSSRWGDRAAYFGTAEPGDVANLHFPAFGEDAARFLVDERNVAAIGLDTPSLDHGPSSDFPVHRITGARDVPGFENLTNLDALGPVGATIVALPMNVGGGSGAPLRAIAIVPRAAER